MFIFTRAIGGEVVNGSLKALRRQEIELASADREQVSLRDAAYLIAIERVARACRERGWV
jgi:glutamate dehydrogenase/leucine dehydrogenase